MQIDLLNSTWFQTQNNDMSELTDKKYEGLGAIFTNKV